MSEEHQPHDEPGPPEAERPLEHADIRYERTDTTLWPVVMVAVAAAVIGAGLFAGIYMFFHQETNRLAIRRTSEFPLAQHPSSELPVNPRLEEIDRLAGIETPNVYLLDLRKEQVLNSLGPTAEKGFVHVPISRAMQVLAEPGHLPFRADQPPASTKDHGLVDAGASNSGRMFRKGTP
jgi:hypothetical protein